MARPVTDTRSIIDAHVHLWDLAARDQPWIPRGSRIRRDFTIADLRAAIDATPVERVVIVQVLNNADETAALLNQSEDTADLIAGVVGWVDLAEPSLSEALARMSRRGRLVGIRHQALAEADPAGWLGSPAVQRGLAQLDRAALPFDLMIRPSHFAAALTVARAHPSLQLVLDHVGKPAIAAGELLPWAAGLRELAREPNVSCKLSGVQTMAAADWTFADLAPFLDVALNAFGAGRIVFGSDWPVSAQAAAYQDVLDVAMTACATLSSAERDAVLADNARRIYRLEQGPDCGNVRR